MAAGKISGVFLTHIFGPCDLGLKTFSSTFIEYLLNVSETIISPLRQITGQILKSEYILLLPPLVELCYSLEDFSHLGSWTNPLGSAQFLTDNAASSLTVLVGATPDVENPGFPSSLLCFRGPCHLYSWSPPFKIFSCLFSCLSLIYLPHSRFPSVSLIVTF